MAFSDSEPRDARGRWTSGGAKLAAGDDETVKLFFASGGAQTRRGGDPTWRANNPGAVPVSDYAYGVDAIGTAGDLAVFPDPKTGFRAARWNLAQYFDHLSFLEATRQGRADREDRNRIWISADHRFPRLLGAAAHLPISNLTGEEFDRGLDLFASLDRGEPGTASWNPLERPIHNPDPKFRSLALNAAQDFAVRDPKYVPKNGVTHCNEATVAIADTFGVARGILGSETGEPFMANVQVENLETASRTSGTKWSGMALCVLKMPLVQTNRVTSRRSSMGPIRLVKFALCLALGCGLGSFPASERGATASAATLDELYKSHFNYDGRWWKLATTQEKQTFMYGIDEFISNHIKRGYFFNGDEDRLEMHFNYYYIENAHISDDFIDLYLKYCQGHLAKMDQDALDEDKRSAVEWDRRLREEQIAFLEGYTQTSKRFKPKRTWSKDASFYLNYIQNQNDLVYQSFKNPDSKMDFGSLSVEIDALADKN